MKKILLIGIALLSFSSYSYNANDFRDFSNILLSYCNNPSSNLQFNSWDDVWFHTWNPFCSSDTYENALNRFYRTHNPITCPTNWNKSQETIKILNGYSALFSLKNIHFNLNNFNSNLRNGGPSASTTIDQLNYIFFKNSGNASELTDICFALNEVLPNLDSSFSNLGNSSFIVNKIDEILSNLNRKFDTLKGKSIQSGSEEFIQDFLIWVRNRPSTDPTSYTCSFTLTLTRLTSSLANIFLVQQGHPIPSDIAPILR